MKLKTLSLQNYIYLVAYALFIITRNISNSMLSQLMGTSFLTLLRWSIVILLMIAFLLKKDFKQKAFFRMVVLVLLGFIVFFNVKNVDYLCVILLIVMCLGLNLNYEKIIDVSIKVNIFMMILIVGLSLLGVLGDNVYTHGSIIAHSYGYKYYSTVSFNVLFTSIMILYKNNNTKCKILMAVVNIATYCIFTTRLPLIIYFLFLILDLIINKVHLLEKGKKIAGIIAYCPVYFFIITIFIHLFYSPSNGVMYALNLFFNTRLAQGHKGLVDYGLSLFGQNIAMQGTYTMKYGNVDWAIGSFYIDNDYLFMFLSYGIIFTFILLYLFTKFYRKTIHLGEYFLFSWCTVTAIFALVNSTYLLIEFNPIVLIGICMLRINKNTSVIKKREHKWQNQFSIRSN